MSVFILVLLSVACFCTATWLVRSNHIVSDRRIFFIVVKDPWTCDTRGARNAGERVGLSTGRPSSIVKERGLPPHKRRLVLHYTLPRLSHFNAKSAKCAQGTQRFYRSASGKSYISKPLRPLRSLCALCVKILPSDDGGVVATPASHYSLPSTNCNHKSIDRKYNLPCFSRIPWLNPNSQPAKLNS